MRGKRWGYFNPTNFILGDFSLISHHEMSLVDSEKAFGGAFEELVTVFCDNSVTNVANR